MKDSTKKILTNVINLVILVLNGIVAMLGTGAGDKVATLLTGGIYG